MSEPKVTQNYILFKLLEDGLPKTVDEIKNALNVSYYSVAVYIHEMKRLYKAEIESVKEGRVVKAYQLFNAANIKVPMYRSNNAVYVKPEPKQIKVDPELKTNKSSWTEEDDLAGDEIDGSLEPREALDVLDSLGISNDNYSSWSSEM